jgi:hypothetical protein
MIFICILINPYNYYVRIHAIYYRLRFKAQQASKLARKVNKNRREMGCLFVARLVNGDLKLDEVIYPDLLMTSQETKKTLNLILKREGT